MIVPIHADLRCRRQNTIGRLTTLAGANSDFDLTPQLDVTSIKTTRLYSEGQPQYIMMVHYIVSLHFYP